MTLSIIQTVSSLQPEAGGPSRSVTSLCDSLVQHNIAVHLLSVDFGPRSKPPILPASAHVRTHLAKAELCANSRQFWTPQLANTLTALIAHTQASVVHDNGIWLGFNQTVAKVALKNNVRFAVSTHGMLEPWALQFGAWKKRVAWKLYQERITRSAHLLHATSDSEAEHLRSLGLTQPIAVVANGVSIPNSQPPVHHTGHNEKRTILFLSRIYPVKGLLNLVEAMAILKPAGWEVVVAGPSEMNHQQEVQDAVQTAGLSRIFRFVGSLTDEEKWKWYQLADLFVLPTHSENFGIVVAEALASGVPVITTKGAPWQDLVTNDCGWWVDIGVEPLVAAMREAMQMPPERLRRMGQHGRRLVQQKYSWKSIAEQMATAYTWLIGNASKPSWVYT